MPKTRTRSAGGKRPGATNQLRIIAGRWRGRRLRFADSAGLRPTADRSRETLFNWLQPVVAGSRCLDLFAGSGALGLEAASRGAEHVLLVERAGAAVRSLQENIALLNAGEQVELQAGDALAFLRAGRGDRLPFNIVFLDPPFADSLLDPVCRLLAERGWLASGARVYLETGREQGLPALPDGWTVLRQRTAGQVLYALLIVPECENRFETDPG